MEWHAHFVFSLSGNKARLVKTYPAGTSGAIDLQKIREKVLQTTSGSRMTLYIHGLVKTRGMLLFNVVHG